MLTTNGTTVGTSQVAARAAVVAAVAGAAAMLALMAVAPEALAAQEGTFETAVTDVRNTVSSVGLTIGYALLALVAALALISIAKEVLPALFARQRAEFRDHITAIIVVLVVILVAAFLPDIVNGVSATAGTGVDLGSANKG